MARRFVFVGGKGGVGKTTVSSALALGCARDGERTLLVSTDPAHSTADVFDQPFSDEPQAVDGHEHLSVLEIDPEREVREHLQELKRELGAQVSPVMVNEVDLQLEMAHRTPGAYEAALFDRFVDVMADAETYDRVVFDTSPTGGTLRLLSLPELLEGWVERLLEKRRESVDLYERAAIGGRTPRRLLEGDPIIDRLETRRERFAFARETLTESSVFALVMNPDSLSLRETERALETLTESGLSVGGVVVNRVTPEPESHEEGRGARYLRERCATERERIREARASLEVPVVAELETRVGEVTGETLERVAEEISLSALAVDS
ncbi:ArsA family ATPase [Natronobiforma cellulositropha]|uniref:ArsA family ATPase n=1 Tax=Natronobiforma cellulositropha TaxID=1679076 RepID=UPI0021D5BAD8|nr:ArsA family ATPase [Natronobiforma cellulositropha]